MYNWSTNLSRLKKIPDQYQKFLLEQRINFGLNQKKLSIKALKKYWHELVIDPHKKDFLKKVLWPQS